MEILKDFDYEMFMIDDSLKKIVDEINDPEQMDIIDKMNYIRKDKINKFIDENDLEQKFSLKEKEKIENITKYLINNNELLNDIHSNALVELNKDGEIEFKFNHKDFHRLVYTSSNKYNKPNNNFKFKSFLYHICAAIEKSFNSLIYNFYKKVDKSNSLDEVDIKYEYIKEFSSKDELQDLAIEKKVKHMFYGDFTKWNEEILKTLKLKKSLEKGENFKDNIKFIADMFEIRNCFIHNDGKILSKHNKLLKDNSIIDVDKNNVIQLNEEYIYKCIDISYSFVLEVTYEYYFSKYRSDADELFGQLNSILVKRLENNKEAIPNVYLKSIENDKVNEKNKGLAVINYCLNKYYNNEDYMDELRHHSFLDDYLDCKMAKSILLFDNESLKLVEKYIEDIIKHDKMKLLLFLNFYEWPIIKVAKENDEKIKELIDFTFNEIFGVEN
ncbi:hypothetical protein EFY80_04940 [Staphylococcus cohnii]|nr:hypothetical protein BSF33_05250 [Staphylococcus ureilyticus]RNM28120.1 hypothetical protein EFY80_04940 [Staphylococcus cohnii]